MSDSAGAGVLVISHWLAARAGVLERGIRARMGPFAPRVVFLDAAGEVVCDCEPYVEAGRCEHWNDVAKPIDE